jgi:hypothetical protein
LNPVSKHSTLKTTGKILSLFNLVLFITSFCFSYLFWLPAPAGQQMDASATQQLTPYHGTQPTGPGQSFFEKSEKENEVKRLLMVLAILLPFLTTYLAGRVQLPVLFNRADTSGRQPDPVYLSIRSLRI